MKTFLVIFITLFLVQSISSKAVEDVSSSEEIEEMRKNPTASQKLVLYTYDNLMQIGQHFSKAAVKVCRQVLKDEAIVSNHNHDVLEFKKNITLFVEKVEHNHKPKAIWDILEIYTDTIDNFTEIPEGQETAESKVIVEVLEKYNYRSAALEMAKDFKKFMDDFIKMFEKNKADLEKPLMDWYEKYQTLNAFEKKIEALTDLIDIYDD